MTRPPYEFDPKRDLKLERVVDVPRELVWRAWTRPEEIVKWFAPAPWKTVECEIDLRPGGAFRTVMRSPEGKDYPNVGCLLEIVESRRLIWTDALERAYRPSEKPFFTAVLILEPHPKGTEYTVFALHKDAEDRVKHEEMGFYAGWGQCLDQLVAVAKKMQS